MLCNPETGMSDNLPTDGLLTPVEFTEMCHKNTLCVIEAMLLRGQSATQQTTNPLLYGNPISGVAARHVETEDHKEPRRPLQVETVNIAALLFQYGADAFGTDSHTTPFEYALAKKNYILSRFFLRTMSYACLKYRPDIMTIAIVHITKRPDSTEVLDFLTKVIQDEKHDTMLFTKMLLVTEEFLDLAKNLPPCLMALCAGYVGCISEFSDFSVMSNRSTKK
jgi:hypothetical protein